MTQHEHTIPTFEIRRDPKTQFGLIVSADQLLIVQLVAGAYRDHIGCAWSYDIEQDLTWLRLTIRHPAREGSDRHMLLKAYGKVPLNGDKDQGPI